MMTIMGLDADAGQALRLGTDVQCDQGKNVCSGKTVDATSYLQYLQGAINRAAAYLGVSAYYPATKEQILQLATDGVLGPRTLLLAHAVAVKAANDPTIGPIAKVDINNASQVWNFVQALALTPYGYAQAFDALIVVETAKKKKKWWIGGVVAVAAVGSGYWYWRRRKAGR